MAYPFVVKSIFYPKYVTGCYDSVFWQLVPRGTYLGTRMVLGWSEGLGITQCVIVSGQVSALITY